MPRPTWCRLNFSDIEHEGLTQSPNKANLPILLLELFYADAAVNALVAIGMHFITVWQAFMLAQIHYDQVILVSEVRFKETSYHTNSDKVYNDMNPSTKQPCHSLEYILTISWDKQVIDTPLIM